MTSSHPTWGGTADGSVLLGGCGAGATGRAVARAPTRSGLEAEGQVLLDVLLGDHRSVEHDALGNLDLDEVAQALALRDEAGELDAVGRLRRRVEHGRLHLAVLDQA